MDVLGARSHCSTIHITHESTSAELKAHLLDVLENDAVLGPLLSYGRCIVTRRGRPLRECCWGTINSTCAGVHL